MNIQDKLTKNMLASVHINFLFGAGVNGAAFPQLNRFSNTLDKIKELGGDVSKGLEFGIDLLDSESKKKVKDVFVEEFSKYHEEITTGDELFSHPSIKNLESMFRTIHTLVSETQNRNPSMKQVGVYTLNYDIIVERVLANLGYLYNEISASNTATKAALMNVIGYDYNTKKHVPTFMISKLHGDCKNPIIPGKTKYQDILNENYFEIAFDMKEHLCRSNSVLFVIGYSGADKHINAILKDCMNAGLIIFWYKYSEQDEVPFEENSQFLVREQDDYTKKSDMTQVFHKDIGKVWAEK